MLIAILKEKVTLAWILEVIRFGIVGLSATFIHLGIAILLANISDINLFIINTIAFLCAFIVSFCGHYFWTFKSSAPKLSSFIKFFAVAFAGLCASQAMLGALIFIGITNVILKLMISILIIPIVTYVIGKLWAFKD